MNLKAVFYMDEADRSKIGCADCPFCAQGGAVKDGLA